MAILFMAPILYVIINSFSTERKMKKQITAMYGGNKTSFTNFEVIGNTILALDGAAKKIIFSNTKNPKETYQLIDLNALQQCEIKTEKQKNKILDCVELELVGEGFSKEIFFYQENEEDSAATDAQICLEQARQWQKMINKAKAA